MVTNSRLDLTREDEGFFSSLFSEKPFQFKTEVDGVGIKIYRKDNILAVYLGKVSFYELLKIQKYKKGLQKAQERVGQQLGQPVGSSL